MNQPDDHSAKPQPNRKLEAARLALPSPSGAPEMPMSRRELAEAANAYAWQHTKGQHRVNMTDHDIGRYERGEVHWPSQWRRCGLRGALGASSDTQLGFYPNRKTIAPAATPATNASAERRLSSIDLDCSSDTQGDRSIPDEALATAPEATHQRITTPLNGAGKALLAAGIVSHTEPRDTGDRAASEQPTQLVDKRMADLDSVFTTRSELNSQLPPHALFDTAKDIRAAGLSLNVLCQQYPDDRLRSLIEAGGTVHCLFLDPGGRAIRDREQEEGLQAGHLSSLNEINIQVLLHRVRQRLPKTARERLVIATYDQTIRFNITLIDGSVAVVQPYLHTARGVESPTFVLRRQSDGAPGLYPLFEQTFTWLWEQRTEL